MTSAVKVLVIILSSLVSNWTTR